MKTFPDSMLAQGGTAAQFNDVKHDGFKCLKGLTLCRGPTTVKSLRAHSPTHILAPFMRHFNCFWHPSSLDGSCDIRSAKACTRAILRSSEGLPCARQMSKSGARGARTLVSPDEMDVNLRCPPIPIRLSAAILRHPSEAARQASRNPWLSVAIA